MWHRRRGTDDFNDEVRAHIDLETDRLMRLGMSEDEARRTAYRNFGNTTQAGERFYERGRRLWMDHLFQDVRYVLRSLGRNRGWSSIILIVLALGIGANTAIFSVAYNVLVKPLPYPHAEQLVWMWGRFSGGNRASVSPPDFVDYRAQSKLFESMAAAGPASFNLTGSGEPERLTGSLVSAEYFRTLGVTPELGRDFRSDDEQVAQPEALMLSNGLWQRRFGGDPDVVGKTITIDGRPTVVAGVMPAGFSVLVTADVWLPMPLKNPGMSRRGAHFLRPVGRMKPGVRISQAQAELDVIATTLERAYPQTNTTFGIRLESLHDRIVGDSKVTLSILLGAVSLVLLIACANVASLLLSRVTARQREIAVRSALGATSGRIVRLFLTESLVLAISGGTLGALLAGPAVSLLIKTAPTFVPRAKEIEVDGHALLFTAVISILTGLIFGALPTLRAARPASMDALKEGQRVHGSLGRSLAREGLVIVEVALAVVLSIGAGLMIRSLSRITQVNPGFKTANLLTFRMDVPIAKYKTAEERANLFEELLHRIESVPGVQSAALVSQLPLSGQNNDNFFEVEGRPPHEPNQRVTANFRMLSASYFRTMGIPLLRGRTLAPEDAQAKSKVTVVNKALVEHYFPNEDPIGHRLLVDMGTKQPVPFEIVGVVDGIRHFGLQVEPRDEMYVTTLDMPQTNVVVRTSSDPLSLVGAVRAEIRAVDKDQPISNVRSMDDIIELSIGTDRFTTYLLSAFTLMALVLATIGIYGLVAYSVAQRMHEIGLRIALGASRGDIFKWVIGRGFVWGSIGVVLGAIGAWGLTRLLKDLLYQVSVLDPVTFLAIPVLLLAVTLVSSYFPARRAVKVDPMTALRCE